VLPRDVLRELREALCDAVALSTPNPCAPLFLREAIRYLRASPEVLYDAVLVHLEAAG
jgi:hypothetical protein